MKYEIIFATQNYEEVCSFAQQNSLTMFKKPTASKVHTTGESFMVVALGTNNKKSFSALEIAYEQFKF